MYRKSQQQLGKSTEYMYLDRVYLPTAHVLRPEFASPPSIIPSRSSPNNFPLRRTITPRLRTIAGPIRSVVPSSFLTFSSTSSTVGPQSPQRPSLKTLSHHSSFPRCDELSTDSLMLERGIHLLQSRKRLLPDVGAEDRNSLPSSDICYGNSGKRSRFLHPSTASHSDDHTTVTDRESMSVHSRGSHEPIPQNGTSLSSISEETPQHETMERHSGISSRRTSLESQSSAAFDRHYKDKRRAYMTSKEMEARAGLRPQTYSSHSSVSNGSTVVQGPRIVTQHMAIQTDNDLAVPEPGQVPRVTEPTTPSPTKLRPTPSTASEFLLYLDSVRGGNRRSPAMPKSASTTYFSESRMSHIRDLLREVDQKTVPSMPFLTKAATTTAAVSLSLPTAVTTSATTESGLKVTPVPTATSGSGAFVFSKGLPSIVSSPALIEQNKDVAASISLSPAASSSFTNLAGQDNGRKSSETSAPIVGFGVPTVTTSSSRQLDLVASKAPSTTPVLPEKVNEGGGNLGTGTSLSTATSISANQGVVLTATSSLSAATKPTSSGAFVFGGSGTSTSNPAPVVFGAGTQPTTTSTTVAATPFTFGTVSKQATVPFPGPSSTQPSTIPKATSALSNTAQSTSATPGFVFGDLSKQPQSDTTAQTATTSAIFGSTTAAFSFNKAPQPSGALFGAKDSTTTSSAPSQMNIFGGAGSQPITTSASSGLGLTQPAATTQSTAIFGAGNQQLTTTTTAASNVFGIATKPVTTVQSSNIFGAPTAVSNVFGVSTKPTTTSQTSSIFGTQPQPAAAASSNVFGTIPQPAATGQASTLFGASTQPAATTASNVFGAIAQPASTTASNVFGAIAQPASITTSNVFGAIGQPAMTGQASSVFATSTQPAAITASNVFGAATKPTTTSQTSSIFGTQVQPVSTTASNVFSGASQQTSSVTTPNIFGTSNQSSLFGNASQSNSNVFGAGNQAAATTSAPSIFGSGTQTVLSANMFGAAPKPAIATTTSSNIFGTGNASQSNTVFGSGNQPANTFQPSSNIFGSSSISANQPTVSSATSQASVFGASGSKIFSFGSANKPSTTTVTESGSNLAVQTTTQPTMFGSTVTGSTTVTSNLFGAPKPAPSAVGNIFGASTQTANQPTMFGSSSASGNPPAAVTVGASMNQPATTTPAFNFFGGATSQPPTTANVFGAATTTANSGNIFGSGGSVPTGSAATTTSTMFGSNSTPNMFNITTNPSSTSNTGAPAFNFGNSSGTLKFGSNSTAQTAPSTTSVTNGLPAVATATSFFASPATNSTPAVGAFNFSAGATKDVSLASQPFQFGAAPAASNPGPSVGGLFSSASAPNLSALNGAPSTANLTNFPQPSATARRLRRTGRR